jgi:WD40 repeat protein
MVFVRIHVMSGRERFAQWGLEFGRLEVTGARPFSLNSGMRRVSDQAPRVIREVNRYSSDLYISLANWQRLRRPSFQISAVHVCDLRSSSRLPHNLSEEIGAIEAIVFAGSLRGEIASFLVGSERTIPFSCGFGHSSKIVEIASCSIPLFTAAVVSLSVDGTLCTWNAHDGICIGCYPHLVPNGCRKLAISASAIEIAVIAGAFPAVYVVNIHEGRRMQILHPCTGFVVGLQFYATAESEWLFAMDHTGCATYSSLTKTTASHKLRLVTPENGRPILNAVPSPDFSFLLIVYENGYSVIDLCSHSFPSYSASTESCITRAVWPTISRFAYIEMCGKVAVKELVDARGPIPHSQILESLTNSLNTPVIQWNPGCPGVPLGALREDRNNFVDPFHVSGVPGRDHPPRPRSRPKAPRSTAARQIAEERKITEPTTVVEAQSQVEMPTIAPWMSELILAFDDVICNLPRNFEECSLPQAFMRRVPKDPVTAQCFLSQKKEIIGLVEGTLHGKIRIRYLHVATKREITAKKHNGRVVTLFVRDQLLFTSGKDCLVFIFELPNAIHLSTISLFTAPVISFCLLAEKTNTDVDNSLFCITSNSVVTTVDVHRGEQFCKVKKMMTGHDGKVQNIWFSGPSKMLIIEANSLYLWSLISGDLESILTGNQKYEFLKDANRFTRVIPATDVSDSYSLVPVRFGNLSLQLPLLNIFKIHEETKKVFEEYIRSDLAEVLRHVPNLPLILDLLGDHARHFFRSRGQLQFPRGHFSLVFVGQGRVPTFYFSTAKLSGRGHWQLSALASANILATRVLLSLGMRFHPTLQELREHLFRIDIGQLVEHVPGFQVPSLFHVFTYLFPCQDELYEFVFDIMSTYAEEVRRAWLLKLERASSFFPHLARILMLVWCTSTATLLQSLKIDEVQKSGNYLMRELASEEIGSYVRELIVRGIDAYHKTITIDELKLVIRAIASHANRKHPNDIRSLRILFQKQRQVFLTVVHGVINEGHAPLIRAFFQEMATSIAEIQDRDEIEKIVMIFGEAVEKGRVDRPEPLFEKVSQASPWVDWRNRILAFGDTKGILKVSMVEGKKVLRGHYDTAPPAESFIDRVAFDPSAALLLVHTPAHKGAVKVIRVIPQLDAGEFKFDLRMAWQSCSGAVPTWVGERAMMIGNSRIDWPN